MDTVSFPNLGIGEIKLNPIAFNITESISIKWYAIIIVFGIIVAYFVCDKLRKRFNISSDDFLDCLIYSLPVAFLGARLTYVLGDPESVESFFDIFAIWDGGIAIYGGIIFAAISVYVVCRIKKCDFRSMLDLMAIGLLIGQIIGRWGNFVNVEVYGVATNLPWAMGVGYFGKGASELVHPLFLYESLWNLIGFVLIYGYMYLRKFKGEVFLWYMAWYGLGRGLLEPLRNSEYNLHLFGIRIMMVLAFALSAAAIVCIVIFRRKCRSYIVKDIKTKAEIETENYEHQFDLDMDDIEMTEQEYEDKKLYDAMDKKLEDKHEEKDDGSDN